MPGAPSGPFLCRVAAWLLASIAAP